MSEEPTQSESDRACPPSAAAASPIPLTDFECYMLLDDRPSHPMVITMALQLTGDLKQDLFGVAINESLENHPLLRSIVVGKKLRLSWQPTDSRPAVDWSNGISKNAPPVPYVDLTQTIGLQVRGEWTEGRSVVYFFFHHACCDGISSVRFIAEVLSRYGRLEANPDTLPLPVFQHEQLLRRDEVKSQDKLRPRASVFIKEVTTIFTKRALRLRQSAVRVAEDQGRAIITRTLPRFSVRQLRSAASQLGVSLNDLCTAEFARTLKEWNGTNCGTGAGRLRLIVPVSTRLPKHDEMSAANCISYLPIEFNPAEMSDAAVVARAVHARTAAALDCNFGLLFLKALSVARHLPWVLGWFTARKRRLCTAIFASVGDIRRHVPVGFSQSQGRLVAGNIRVDRIDGVAPIRPNTAVAVSCGTYAGDMIFNLRADSAILSNDDADMLLDSFVAQLQSHCQPQTAKVAA
ncbi:MAG: hypothetical protein AB8G99_24105 [Planctomycetaceae bacterium]